MTQHLHHPFGTLPILLLGLSLSGWAEAQSDGIVDGKNFLIWQDGLHGTSGKNAPGAGALGKVPHNIGPVKEGQVFWSAILQPL